jgi:hypothetical protein
MSAIAHAPTGLDAAAVVSKAVVRAARDLSIPQAVLAKVLGLSASSTTRLAQATYQLDAGQKPYELALLFLRLYRSLDAIAGGDGGVTRSWIRASNTALNGAPIDLIQSVSGLVHVLAYLDARRALV